MDAGVHVAIVREEHLRGVVDDWWKWWEGDSRRVLYADHQRRGAAGRSDEGAPPDDLR